MSPAQLDTFLDAESDRIDRVLDEIVPPARGGSGHRPEDGRSVHAAARYAVSGGGKRLRPILCVAAYRAFRPEVPPAAYRLAAALELIHAYSLVHDDLPSMDDDEVRRGRPATHVAHGVPAATLAGGALIPRAIGVVADAADELDVTVGVRRELVLAVCSAAGGGGMVGGQLLDLQGERRPLGLADLERIHRLKTGALLGVAPVVGGLAAGADQPARTALARYGEALGLAFQIADDILDVTGSTSVLGKTAGRDTALEKATYPSLAGLAAAGRRAEEEVEGALAALAEAGVESDELNALARYSVERDR